MIKKEDSCEKNDNSKYSDIIDFPHPVSRKHPRMPLSERAAQFSPFAALTGYEEIIEKSSRYSVQKPDLTETEKTEIDRILREVSSDRGGKKRITVSYFIRENKKEDGEIRTVSGFVKKTDLYQRTILFDDGTKIFIDSVISAEFTVE